MSKEKKRRKPFDPNKSRGLNGMPPHKRYPHSKLIQAVFSVEKKRVDVPTICEEHNMVSYKDLSALTKKCYKIIDRLSYLLVRKEQQCETLARHIKEISKKMGGDDAQ